MSPLRFSPPTVASGVHFRADADAVTQRLWGHFKSHERGRTVLKTGGTYIETDWPYHDDLEAADVVYQGGHIYDVDLEEGLALLAAGYDLRGFGSWVQSLGNRDDAQATILALGDSNTEQTAATTIATRWTNVAQEELRSRYPTTGVSVGGIGYQAAYDQSGWLSAAEDTVTTGTVANADSYGLGYKAIVMGAGSTVTFPARTCTSIRVWFSSMNQSGTLSVSVDGGTPVLVPCGYPSIEYHTQWFDIPLGASASHTVVVSVDAVGTGFYPNPVLDGIQFFDGDEGDTTLLRFDGSEYGFTQTPDSAALSITGDIGLAMKVAPTSPVSAAEQWVISKWDPNVALRKSYVLAFSTEGKPKLYWSADGNNPLSATSSQVATAGELLWHYATLDCDNGAGGYTVNFYTSDDPADRYEDVDPGSWVLQSTTSTTSGTTSVHDGAAVASIGATPTGFVTHGEFAGDIHAVAIEDGIGGTVVASPCFTGATSKYVADPQGNIWKQHASATGGPVVIPGGKGIFILNAAQAGQTTGDVIIGATVGTNVTDPANFDVDDLADWVKQPTGMILLCLGGTNEYLLEIDPETYRFNLRTIITALRAASPDTPIVIPRLWEPDLPKAYPWASYLDVVDLVVGVTENCDSLDFSPESGWPQPGTPAGDASGYYFDEVHLTTAGHAAVGARWADALDPLTSELAA